MATTDATPADDDVYDDVTVSVLTDEDVYSWYEEALAEAGVTEDELRARAREHDLGTPALFLAWALLDDFIDPCRRPNASD